jgi:hypothetical protein
MSPLEKYPIDVEKLKKGQLITNKELEHLTARTPGSTEWAFAILALYQFILDNTEFTLKNTPEGLRILTDSEAAVHNHRRFNGHISGAIRRYYRNTLVEIANLDSFEAEQHKHNLINESRYISALTTVGRTIAVEAHSPRLSDIEGAPSTKEI